LLLKKLKCICWQKRLSWDPFICCDWRRCFARRSRRGRTQNGNWSCRDSVVRCRDNVAILSRYCRDIVAILSRYCRDIVAILSRYCRDIVAILSRYRRDIVAISSRYCRDIITILSRYCCDIVVKSWRFARDRGEVALKMVIETAALGIPPIVAKFAANCW
jgi:hypothetical protein